MWIFSPKEELYWCSTVQREYRTPSSSGSFACPSSIPDDRDLVDAVANARERGGLQRPLHPLRVLVASVVRNKIFPDFAGNVFVDLRLQRARQLVVNVHVPRRRDM